MIEIELAKQGKSKLSEEVLGLDGMSSAWNRHLLNLLCKNKTYLEIGTHKGSTLISATYKNGAVGLAYDDYSQFGNHYEKVLGLIKRFKVKAELRNENGFNHKEGNFDVIFYDGEHSEESTIKALGYFWQFLNPGGYYILDDIQFEAVYKAMDLFVRRVKPQATYLYSDKKDDSNTWWNGLAIFKK